jgi:hypothetical protein
MVRPNKSFGARRRQPRGWDIHPSRGGYHKLVTSRDGYQPGLTPGHLNRILAKGQSSTDLILTEAHRASRISVHPSPPCGDPAVDHSPGWNRQTTIQPWESSLARQKSSLGRRDCLHEGSNLNPSGRGGSQQCRPNQRCNIETPRERLRSKAGHDTPSSKKGRTVGAETPRHLSLEPGKYLTGLA